MPTKEGDDDSDDEAKQGAVNAIRPGLKKNPASPHGVTTIQNAFKGFGFHFLRLVLGFGFSTGLVRSAFDKTAAIIERSPINHRVARMDVEL